ncbi:hypothetical protein [Microcoleus sp. B7-D4]|uniref:hypothetical protein n=1 Tax=Microcoleus sp. B7-D4 TaxID=2818696 RepID=UPI002FD05B3F
MQLLAAKFNQIATAIETTNAQIAALQAKLSELQEHQQQLQSVEQACQSALSQVDTALMMLHHVDPTEIATFKDALGVKFATDAIGILSPTNTAPAEPIEPEPTAPTAPETSAEPEIEPAIDVEVTETPETPATDAPIVPAPTTTAADIEGLLNKMTIQNIRKLASAKKVSGNGTRAAIAGRLKAIVTQADIWNATA